MSDIVKRLRSGGPLDVTGRFAAADEIERLRLRLYGKPCNAATRREICHEDGCQKFPSCAIYEPSEKERIRADLLILSEMLLGKEALPPPPKPIEQEK